MARQDKFSGFGGSPIDVIGAELTFGIGPERLVDLLELLQISVHIVQPRLKLRSWN